MRSRVRGSTVDDQARCVHYHGSLDVVAIQFRCCGDFYACHRCHEESASHPTQLWLRQSFDERAILCGVCSTTLSIATYLTVTACPNCAAQFNPRCALHTHLYFEGPFR